MDYNPSTTDARLHLVACQEIIATMAGLVQVRYGKIMERAVVMIGDHFLLQALVDVEHRYVVVPGTGDSGHRVHVQIGDFYPSAREIEPLARMFKKKLPEMGLIPASEKKEREARELGDIVEEQQDFFVVRRGRSLLPVYRIPERLTIVSPISTV